MTGYRLKPLAEVFIPDKIHSVLGGIDASGIFQPNSIDNHYAVIDAIQLDSNVPEDIANSFNTSRNVLLYAWFVNSFIPVAEMQSYVALEFALKMRAGQELGEEKASKIKGLHKLFDLGLRRNWLRNEGIRQNTRIEEMRRESLHSYERAFGLPEDSFVQPIYQPYIEMLAQLIPDARNILAHGSSWLSQMHSGYLTLEICCDLINQLFPNSSTLPVEGPQHI